MVIDHPLAMTLTEETTVSVYAHSRYMYTVDGQFVLSDASGTVTFIAPGDITLTSEQPLHSLIYWVSEPMGDNILAKGCFPTANQ